MSKQNNKQLKPVPGKSAPGPSASKSRLKSILGSVLFIGLVVGILWGAKHFSGSKDSSAPSVTAGNSPSTAAASSTNQTPLPGTTAPVLRAASEISTMQMNQAVMVTVELDFGPTIPSIAEALQFIERRYQPDDGKGRTFAILDAYGEPTADKKKLHVSMHVSSEKPGLASLVFSRTGEVLWKTKIVPSTNANPFSGKDLTIYLDSGLNDGKDLTIYLDSGLNDGKAWLLDGSMGPATILYAKVRDLNKPVRDVWLEGEEREMTFVYSACGCPVKVKVKRTGDRTVRTRELPVIFPDDPAVVGVISKLMGW